MGVGTKQNPSFWMICIKILFDFEMQTDDSVSDRISKPALVGKKKRTGYLVDFFGHNGPLSENKTKRHDRQNTWILPES